MQTARVLDGGMDDYGHDTVLVLSDLTEVNNGNTVWIVGPMGDLGGLPINLLTLVRRLRQCDAVGLLCSKGRLTILFRPASGRKAGGNVEVVRGILVASGNFEVLP